MTDNTKKSDDGFTWFIDKIKQVVDTTKARFSKKYEKIARPTPDNTGQMFMFYYDAKWKKKLPYWDKFPLVLPIKFYKDGFLGMNLHYLPPVARMKLLGALSERTVLQGTPKQKLNISYDILNNTAKYKAFKPCLKRYLWSHVATEFFQVKPEEWKIVIMLPNERFTSHKGTVTKTKIWNDSINSLGF